MGRQKGPIKITGTLGDITFVKTKNGYLVKTKSEVSKEMLEKSDSFKKLRANKVEFARAGTAVKLVRHAFDDLVQLGKDSTLSQRLQKLMMEVVHSDTTVNRGLRVPERGDATILEGFQFNDRAEWTRSLRVDYNAMLDRANGKFSLTLPPFTPGQVATPPEGSNYFRIVCACSEIDFRAGTKNTVTAQTDYLPIDDALLTLPPINGEITPDSDKLLLLVVGIQFSQEVNGFQNPDTGGDFNALTLVTVDQV